MAFFFRLSRNPLFFVGDGFFSGETFVRSSQPLSPIMTLDAVLEAGISLVEKKGVRGE